MEVSFLETIGSFEAKTHLPTLLDRVALGAEIVITKRGKPVARLIPERSNCSDEINEAITELKYLRKGVTLGGEDWKAWRDEGR